MKYTVVRRIVRRKEAPIASPRNQMMMEFGEDEGNECFHYTLRRGLFLVSNKKDRRKGGNKTRKQSKDDRCTKSRLPLPVTKSP
jgi:hypothetical protein